MTLFMIAGSSSLYSSSDTTRATPQQLLQFIQTETDSDAIVTRIRKEYPTIGQKIEYLLVLEAYAQILLLKGELEESARVYLNLASLEGKAGSTFVQKSANLYFDLGQIEKAEELNALATYNSQSYLQKENSYLLDSRISYAKGDIPVSWNKTISMVTHFQTNGRFSLALGAWSRYLVTEKGVPFQKGDSEQIRNYLVSGGWNGDQDFFTFLFLPPSIALPLSNRLVFQSVPDSTQDKIEKAVKKQYIQVGSFADAENSAYFAKEIEKLGVKPRVLEEAKNQSVTLYKVVVDCGDSSQVNQLMLKLKDAGYEGYLVTE